MGSACCTRKSVTTVPSAIQQIIDPPKTKEVYIQQKAKSFLWLSETLESNTVDMSLLSTRRKIKWRRGELIGEGAYAKVYQAINTETGELVAVKHFKISDNPRRVEREFFNLKREIYLLKELTHPNIVQYYQTDLNEENYTVDLVMEYVSGGSLKRIVQKYRGLEENVIRKYTKQLLDGLQYLHRNGIIHRDLKCANILLSHCSQVKISDFGSSKEFSSKDLTQITKSLKGSPYWMAPEVVQRQGHSFSADVWSLGCCIIEMVTGNPPWSNYSKNAKEVLNIIATDGRLPDLPNCSKDLLDLIKQCLKRNPVQRATIRQLQEHLFFKSHEEEAEKKIPTTLSVFNKQDL